MRRFLAALAVLMMTAPAMAQTPNCAAQWTRLIGVLSNAFGVKAPPPGLFRQMADGGCRTDGLSFPTNDHLVLKAESLTWRGRDMGRFVNDGLPPTGLSLTMSGIRMVPQVGDKTFQYLQDIQSRGQDVELTLTVNWDEADKVVSLDNLTIRLPGDDFVRLNGRIEGVDLSTAESLAGSAASFGVTEMNLEVRSERMFQDYLLFPFGMAVLIGHENPDARMAELIALGKAAVADAPLKLVSAGSKAALTDLLDDLPDPAGRLTINQTANPGIGVARGLAFGMGARSIKTLDDIWPFFDGISVKIDYERF